MTIEGVPEFKIDWKEEYASQRYNRLVDCLSDYMQDMEIDRLMDDIQAATIEMETYHLVNGNAWRQIRDRIFLKKRASDANSNPS